MLKCPHFCPGFLKSWLRHCIVHSGSNMKTNTNSTIYKWPNFTVFRLFFAQFVVTWSKFTQSVYFDIVFTMNIHLLCYDAQLLHNRGTKSQNSCLARLVSSHLQCCLHVWEHPQYVRLIWPIFTPPPPCTLLHREKWKF